MSENLDQKYIVFKREEFFQTLWTITSLNDYKNHRERFDDLSLKDAVVIRTQDEISPPVLDLYASVLTLVNGADNPTADYFHTRAVEAWQRADRKLPD